MIRKVLAGLSLVFRVAVGLLGVFLMIVGGTSLIGAMSHPSPNIFVLLVDVLVAGVGLLLTSWGCTFKLRVEKEAEQQGQNVSNN
jgi:hypothetical protein